MIPYLEINNISDWKHYLGSGTGELNLGQSYQNIKITGEVDFSDMTSSSLTNYLNVKAAKVQATEEGKITNLTYTASRAGETIFADISGDMNGLAFEKVTLDVSSYGGSSIGLIGHLQGNGADLSFTDITVNAGTATEVGCIGTMEGSLTRINLHNINVRGRGDYIGGLAGLARGEISDVTMSGDVSGTAANTVYGSNVINDGNSQGTGGLIGIPYGPMENVEVTGTHGQRLPESRRRQRLYQ